MKRLALVLSLAPVQAGAFDLALPLDCTLGQTCFIQNYADRDPGPAARDFTCGNLVYDGHDGTDFALPTLAAMQNGVEVRAAADGTVKGLRDGMPDISRRDPAAQPLAGRDCGNGVLIDHGDGWETQYCHMARGSITVTQGQILHRGDALGLVGLSGNTEFPHVHLTLRKNGAAIDPFDPDPDHACGAPPAQTLWATPITYHPGGLTDAGLTTNIPQWSALTAGLAQPAPTKTAAALVVWAVYYGSKPGDLMKIGLTGPQGAVLDETVTLEKQQVRGFRAVGKRLRAPSWPSGAYVAEISLLRGQQVIDTRRFTTTLP